MNTIDLKLSLSQFQSLKVLLLYVLDNEHESYDEYIEENGTEFDDHIYKHAVKVSKALTDNSY